MVIPKMNPLRTLHSPRHLRHPHPCQTNPHQQRRGLQKSQPRRSIKALSQRRWQSCLLKPRMTTTSAINTSRMTMLSERTRIYRLREVRVLRRRKTRRKGEATEEGLSTRLAGRDSSLRIEQVLVGASEVLRRWM